MFSVLTPTGPCDNLHISVAIVRKPSPPVIERRTSSVSEEDREKAREFRKNALKAEGASV